MKREIPKHSNSLDRIRALENENKRLEEENKKLKEKLSKITMVADDEKQSIEHILELEEENKKLKEENEYRHKIVDIIPEGEGNVAEETIKDLQDRIKELEEENKKLREELSAYDREYFDEDKKAKNIFTEEDTLQ